MNDNGSYELYACRVRHCNIYKIKKIIKKSKYFLHSLTEFLTPAFINNKT